MGGTIMLLALFAQSYTFGQRYGGNSLPVISEHPGFGSGEFVFTIFNADPVKMGQIRVTLFLKFPLKQILQVLNFD